MREHHPLAISAGARKDLLREADLIVLIGLQVGYFEGFSDWKSKARFIQINNTPQDVLPALPTELELIGDVGAILEQMLAVASPSEVEPDRASWLARTAKAERAFVDAMDAEARAASAERPIHPRWLGKVIGDFAGPDDTLVMDSFTASAFFLDQCRASRGGQILDAGLSAAFGHGVGMGIGAQIARPGMRVLVLMGDAGMGLGGGDIETAARYGQPVVYVVYNDSTMCAGLERYCYGENFRVLGPNARGGFHFTRDVRYDLMYAHVGCHAEHVERPEEIAPALERAFASGKTAVVNVIGTRDVRHPLYDSSNAKELFWHLPADEVEEPARKRPHEYFYPRLHPTS